MNKFPVTNDPLYTPPDGVPVSVMVCAVHIVKELGDKLTVGGVVLLVTATIELAEHPLAVEVTTTVKFPALLTATVAKLAGVKIVAVGGAVHV